jgi:hypothetical protein
MVIVKAKIGGRSEWVRESFISPQHYLKWKALMGQKLLEVKPVRTGRHFQ